MGVYGSIQGRHMQRVFAALHLHCGLGPTSHFVDAGAGLGKPLIHAALLERIPKVTGYEFDPIKCQKAAAFAKLVYRRVSPLDVNADGTATPIIHETSIASLQSLQGATHLYSFWEGWSPEDKKALSALVSQANPAVLGIAIVQRGIKTTGDVAQTVFQFENFSLVDSFPVAQAGSGRHFVAFIFKRNL